MSQAMSHPLQTNSAGTILVWHVFPEWGVSFDELEAVIRHVYVQPKSNRVKNGRR